MKKILRIMFLFAMSLNSLLLFAQNSQLPVDYFCSPLDFQLSLSGTFGELRSNHFHSGIDIKTQGSEGKNVYSVADGYVSRIKVSAGGYGKALYISHPNGFVSVYGHLQKYNGKIEEYVRKMHYQNESYELDLYPDKGMIIVKKGEVVAFSGNSGSSGGPHLHFEIREEESQNTINPLLINSFKINDATPPSILELAVYPVDEQSLINGKNDTVFFATEAIGSGFQLKGNPKIIVSNNISFGIRAFDPMNDNANKNGVYKIVLLADNKPVYTIEMNKLSFSTSRYVNSLIDYNYLTKAERRIVRTQIDTNNQLFNYQNVINNGIFRFTDSLMHKLVFRVSDVYGNQAELKFSVQSKVSKPSPITSAEKQANSNELTFFEIGNENEFETDKITLVFPEEAFYRSFWFNFKEQIIDSNAFSPKFWVGNRFIPVQKSFTVSIKSKDVPERLKNKLYIGFSPDGKKFSYVGSTWNYDRIIGKSIQFGCYTILADTIKPVISPVNISNGKNIASQKNLKVTIDDKETGIQNYRGTINGKWILMEYDAKNDLLTYTFDENLTKGENEFKLVVTDKVNNETIYRAKVIY